MKVNILTIEDMTNSDVGMFKNWGKVNEALSKFQKRATPKAFKRLFGEDSWRLWSSFVTECDRDVHKFRTYLNTEQSNALLINATLNDKLYIP